MVAIGCLPFVRINRLGRPLNNGKGLFQNQQTTERNGAYHLQFDFPELFSADERLETGKFSKCGGSPQFPNGYSGKLMFRNFRSFSAKCKNFQLPQPPRKKGTQPLEPGTRRAVEKYLC